MGPDHCVPHCSDSSPSNSHSQRPLQISFLSKCGWLLCASNTLLALACRRSWRADLVTLGSWAERFQQERAASERQDLCSLVREQGSHALSRSRSLSSFLRSTGLAGIPRFPTSWSHPWDGGSCLLFLSLTADVGALNNVIQFPVFHFSGKPVSVCMV